METFSLEDLKTKGLEIAKSEGVKKLIASSDGQFFTEANISYAKMHARTTKGIELHDVEYTDEELGLDSVSTPAAAKKSATERIEEVKKMETVADIENYIKDEKAKTVLDAAKARQEEILAAEKATDAAEGRN